MAIHITDTTGIWAQILWQLLTLYIVFHKVNRIQIFLKHDISISGFLVAKWFPIKINNSQEVKSKTTQEMPSKVPNNNSIAQASLHIQHVLFVNGEKYRIPYRECTRLSARTEG